MSILHAGFLHDRTECSITLPTVWNAHETVAAKVVRCRHVGGATHELELAFNDNVDIRHFIERGPGLTRLLTKDLDKATIRGRILVLDDHAIENELIKHHLKGTDLRVETVTKPGEALDLVKTNSYDLIFCDLNLEGDQRGEEVILALRNLGCNAPLFAMTGETSPQRLASAIEAGATAIVEKPLDGARLLASVLEWLLDGARGDGSATEPIHSTLASSPAGADIVRLFLNDVTRQLTSLQKGVQHSDIALVRSTCLLLKESGGTAGFPALSDFAMEAVKALDASCSVMESMKEIEALRAFCSRLRAEAAPAPSKAK
jgi:CheY-like chemotaxis protein